MAEHKVASREWIFQVDSNLTRQTHANAETGSSEGCPCGQCKNYRNQKETVFPDEILHLFSNLGIDHLKECEVYEIERLDNGLHRYGGWFHFAGRIKAGNDCKKQIAENSWLVDLSQINDSFKIGFTSGNDLSFFDRETPLVQVEFETNVRWVIADSWSD